MTMSKETTQIWRAISALLLLVYVKGIVDSLCWLSAQ
jgi:hypothetical protein